MYETSIVSCTILPLNWIQINWEIIHVDLKKRKENEIDPSTAKYKKEGAKASDRLSEEPIRFTKIIPHPELSLPNSVQSNCIFIHQGHTKMMIIIINIAITIDINTNIFITNMMMIKMTKNPEDIAMEDFAIAKSSVAISSAHRCDDDFADDCDDDDDVAT